MSAPLSAAGYALRSARHYWRRQLGVILGTAVGATVLIGGLLVGDSMRFSLQRRALARIGHVLAACAPGDRFFRSELAAELSSRGPHATVAPVLSLPAIASADGGAQRANGVNLMGITEAFLGMGLEAYAGAAPAAGEVLLNEVLARQLHVAVGDRIVLRMSKPSGLPRDLALAVTEDATHALPLTVKGILGAQQLGGFGLRASQLTPPNAFVDLAMLQSELEIEGLVNAMLLGGSANPRGMTDKLNAALRSCWTLADIELELVPLAGNKGHELISRRIFIDDEIAQAVADIPLKHAATGVLTYFVNSLERASQDGAAVRSTPYSMVASLGPLSSGDNATLDPGLAALFPAQPAEDAILVNEWLAEDLGLKVGDALDLKYFVPGSARELFEETRHLTVAGITPIAGLASDPTLMPEFPGIGDSENCRDWETGIPMDLDRIRDKDEAYWDDYRGTPKAFLSLAGGRALWANRFGNLTGIRVQNEDREALIKGLRGRLDPERLGLFFQDVRTPALAGGNTPTDFGGLFLGLSMFLIGSALALTGMLFAFHAEERGRELGTLLALGFDPRSVRRMLLGEAMLLAIPGALVGVLAGSAFTHLVLRGLATLWQGAVGATDLTFHATPLTLIIGFTATMLAAYGAMRWALRGLLRRDPLELLAIADGYLPMASDRHVSTSEAQSSGARSLALFLVSAVLIILAVPLGAKLTALPPALLYFGGAFLLLVLGLISVRRGLIYDWLAGRTRQGSLARLCLGNLSRRRGRSNATVALLASGTFLVTCLGVHQRSDDGDGSLRASGTGGFALLGRSTLPMHEDLNTEAGRAALVLDDIDWSDISVVPLRERPGDDASCLNLAAPQAPRLLGVDPAAFADRDAFAFADRVEGGAQGASPWLLLAGALDPEESDIVPAIGDAASIQWILKRSVGDTLDYVDERGRPFRVRLVASLTDSVLQGSLLIADEAFRARFPSSSGYGRMLIDAPSAGREELARRLTSALADSGLEVVPTTRRLAQFHAVQNTYLDIFQVLGALGVLLGSVGLGVVVLRNGLERQRETALLEAVGFGPGMPGRLLFMEHAALAVIGVTLGGTTALFALWPSLTQGTLNIALHWAAFLPIVVLATSLATAYVAARSATRAAGPELLRA